MRSESGLLLSINPSKNRVMWYKKLAPEMLLEKRRKSWSELLDFTLTFPETLHLLHFFM